MPTSIGGMKTKKFTNSQGSAAPSAVQTAFLNPVIEFVGLTCA
jgi:hypothetical protein